MLPFLNPTNKKSKKYVVAFKGLNYGEGYEDGEFSDAKNISLDEFPCLTQRNGREKEDVAVGKYNGGSNLLFKDGEYGGRFIISDNKLFRNDEEIFDYIVERKKRQMVGIGNYVIIYPEKYYFNVATGEHKPMEMKVKAKMTFTENSITITEDGKTFKFSKGDTIMISGSNKDANNRSATIREYEEKKLTFDANTFTADTTELQITITRTVPELDYICESNYRLWGVKDNTIYGSKYMDPLNFQSFDGSAADSYAIDVSTEGKFTGCIPYTSHICFFKENMLHKLYGSKPANFQLVNSQVYGVQEGSAGSMCIINETLYYKGVNGVYAYNGGIPSLVSDKLGSKMFGNACAATDGNKYYISMSDSAENYGLFVYDVRKNLWVQEDSIACNDMEFGEGRVWMLTKDSLWAVKRDSDEDTYNGETLPIEWSVTFCPFNEVMNERKGYSKFHMRLDLSEGASLLVEVKRNTDTQWEEVKTISSNSSAQTVTVPILPERCDSVEIRLSGRGVCKLRTFIREFYVGSDV